MIINGIKALVASWALTCCLAVKAAPPSTEAKAFVLEKVSLAMCLYANNEINPQEVVARGAQMTKSAIKKFNLRGQDIRDFRLWMEGSSVKEVATHLTSIRGEHGSGPTKCSMEGDSKWLPYVQSLAAEMQ